jgi:hypothetical protein
MVEQSEGSGVERLKPCEPLNTEPTKTLEDHATRISWGLVTNDTIADYLLYRETV